MPLPLICLQFTLAMIDLHAFTNCDADIVALHNSLHNSLNVNHPQTLVCCPLGV